MMIKIGIYINKYFVIKITFIHVIYFYNDKFFLLQHGLLKKQREL